MKSLRPRYNARQRGFTLLELMIALSIFSIAALATLKHSSQTIRHHEQLVDKTLALWVAENTLAEQRLSTPWPATGSRTKAVNSAQRDWQVSIHISDTALSTLRKVIVEVKRDNQDQVVASLTGYLGEH